MELNEQYLTRTLLCRRIFLPMKRVNSYLDKVLYQNVVNDIEGKCIKEGFVQPGSVEIKQYSSGMCKADLVVFDVTVSCLVFLPVKGMRLPCRVANKTIAGLSAYLELANSRPAIIFVPKEHHLATNMAAYDRVKINDVIEIDCVAERFQLHDTQIHVIGVLAEEEEPTKEDEKD